MEFLIFLLALVPLIYYIAEKDRKNKGKTIIWKVDKETSSEIISNNRLKRLQKLKIKKGILNSNDLIVVWAQNFLDHDIFYETVKDNIRDGLRYFYILDRQYVDSFQILLSNLYRDFENKKVIHECIDVIFIKGELTLNNNVLIAPRSDHEILYSSIIYNNRPIGWFKQSPFRAKTFRVKVLNLLTEIAFAQSKNLKIGDKGFYFLEDQIMDYSKAIEITQRGANILDFPIGEALDSVGLDSKSHGKVIELRDRVSGE